MIGFDWIVKGVQPMDFQMWLMIQLMGILLGTLKAMGMALGAGIGIKIAFPGMWSSK